MEMPSDDDNAGGPALPRGVLSGRKGWQGDDMEAQHQRDSRSLRDTVAAVDLSQFRNTVVGEGYQARHVVRQRTAPSTAVSFQDVTTSLSTGDRRKKKKRKSKKSEESATSNRRIHNSDDNHTSTRDSRAQKYMNCDGIRIFRKEIERILASDS